MQDTSTWLIAEVGSAERNPSARPRQCCMPRDREYRHVCVLDEHGRLMDGSCIGANRSSLVVDLQRFRGVLWAAKAGEVAGWWLGAQPLIGIGRSGGGLPAALLNRTFGSVATGSPGGPPT
jgi:hypothetical protein